MKLRRRGFLRLAAGMSALAALPRGAPAQSYPLRPVRFVVGFPAGGTADILARLIGQWLTERLGQTVIIENRPGAGGNIATEAVVRAPADGYTLIYIGTPNAINATLYERLNFDFLRDVAPVAGLTRVPFVVVVNPAFPSRTIAQFIAQAKANPGKINMALGGNGTGPHVASELFKLMAGVDLLDVPYRGDVPAITDLISGQVQVYVSPLPGAIEYIRSGRLRALAVTAQMRDAALPDTPSLGEFIRGYEASGWNGIGAPRNTPPEIIDRLNREINAALVDPKMKARLIELGGTPVLMTPRELGRLMAEDTRKWAGVIRAANIKPE